MEMVKKNKLVIVVSILIVICGLVGGIYLNIKRNKVFEVEAVVKLTGDSYVIVEDSNGEEYFLKTSDKYNIGDRIDFLIKDVDDNSPKTGNVVKINKISKNIDFLIADGNDNENNFDDVNDKQLDVVACFTTLDNELDNYNQNKSLGDNLKSRFVMVIDFLFYNGKINGITFNELSDSTKIRVLELAFSIDGKIEKYFPGYKEEISSMGKKIYINIKNKAIGLYLDITTSVCNYDLDMCDSAKEGLKELKEKFSLSWDFIKETGSSGLNKLKDWYEIWKTI